MTGHSIDDLYELSPMQQGIFFHARATPGSGEYAIQILYTLEGPLNARLLALAWQRVVDRTPTLRTSFHWEVLDKPLQLVHRALRVALERQDWSGLSAEEQERRLDEFLEADRVRPFEFGRPPLMRLALIRVGGRRHHLVWTFHHVILEGWSASAVLEEVFAFYEAFAKGRDIERPLRRPYRDYITWVQQRDAGRVEEYWRRTLGGFEEPTVMGAGASPAAGKGPARYERRRLALTEARTAALQAFARRSQITMSTLVQGAWAVLLGRYSGQDDVVFGSVVSGRQIDLPGAESMVGLFVNTLPARVRLPYGDTLVSWLRALQDSQAEMREFEYTALSDAQAWSGLRRGTRLFDTLFAFENWLGDVSLQGQTSELRTMDVRVSEGGTGYPLVVAAAPGKHLSVAISYDTRRFAPAFVDALLSSFERLLTAMPEGGESRLGDLPVLTAAQEKRLLVEVSSGPADQRRRTDMDVVRAFEVQARRRPGAVAVAAGRAGASYGDLNARANRLARRLRRMGIGPEVRVAIGLERGVELVVAELAVLKAGGAYVPLDVRWPRERVAFVLADAGAPVLLTAGGWLDTAPAGVAVVRLDEDAPAIGGEDPSDLDVPIDLAQLAYVIYTSGSTGRPKGVEITHFGLRNLVAWHRRVYDVLADDRATLIASPAFDASVWEVWPYLTAGASLHVPDDDTRGRPALLKAWLAEQGVTIGFFPTPLAEALAREPWPELTPLRTMLTGGDRLHRVPVDELPFRLINHYGPTESSVVATATEVAPEDAENPPIGAPIDNTRVYVLDRHLRPVPPGVAGELFLGGDGLARGYGRDAALTAERFVPHPFSTVPGARLYRTGDLVRHGTDGRLEFVGRADDQVKVRGFRIELGEIEAVLGEHPAIVQAAVLAKVEASGDTRLLGFVVPRRGVGVDAGEVKAFLRSRLPEYMVPALVKLDALPLNASGKVDRVALTAVEAAGDSPFVAPRSEAEKTVAAVWREVLGRETVGVHDNFFDLGGHSLLIVQVHNRLREVYPQLAIVDLFDRPTVDALARHLGGEPPAPPALSTWVPRLNEGRGRLSQRLEIRERAERTERPTPARRRPADA